MPGIERARWLCPQQRLAAVGAKCRTTRLVDDVAGGLQGLLEIAEDTGMSEALRAAGLDVDTLKREAQEKLVSHRRMPGSRSIGVWEGSGTQLMYTVARGSACWPRSSETCRCSYTTDMPAHSGCLAEGPCAEQPAPENEIVRHCCFRLGSGGGRACPLLSRPWTSHRRRQRTLDPSSRVNTGIT